MPCQHSHEVHGPDAETESDTTEENPGAKSFAIARVIYRFKGDEPREARNQE
jgi:hypothetical protein